MSWHLMYKYGELSLSLDRFAWFIMITPYDLRSFGRPVVMKDTVIGFIWQQCPFTLAHESVALTLLVLKPEYSELSGQSRSVPSLLISWRHNHGILTDCAGGTEACHHDDVMEWKHFPRYWPFVQGIHRPPVNSPHKGQWRGTLMFSLICVSWCWWFETQSRSSWRHCNARMDFNYLRRPSVDCEKW